MNDLLEKTKFDINDIIKILPHRYPFILIDKIEIVEPGISLTALKNVTINEPFFQGHFPGQPIMPGVLSLEVLCQAGSFLMLNQVDDPLEKNMFFTTVEKAKFKKPITPGDQLQIEVELVKRKLNLCKFHGKCNIEGELAVDALFTANLVDRARE
jgi:3-hydroxyacyl-[acyl-carrier-protein] dehydratase